MSSRRKILVYILFALIFIFFLYIAYRYRIKLLRIMTPVLLAVIIAYLIYPIVLWLEEKKISRTWSILIIYFVSFGVITASIIFILPHLINNKRIDEYTSRYSHGT